MFRGLMRLLTVMGVIGLLVIALIWYVQPAQSLNLQYTTYEIEHELEEMIRERRTSMELSEEEVNDLLKEELASHPVESPYARLVGAQFDLVDGGMVAHLHLLAMDRVDVGATLDYTFHWQEPEISAELQRARVKSVSIPQGQIPTPRFAIDLSALLPPFVTVKSMDFNEDVIVLHFQLDV